MYQIGENKKCLKLHESSVRLDTARSTCTSMGAKLILPLNTQEDDDFLTIMQQLGTLDVVIDTKYDDQIGSWIDLSGNSITYTNWKAGQPNSPSTETYAVKSEADNGEWHDYGYSDEVQVVCEKLLMSSSGEVSFIYHGEDYLASASVSSYSEEGYGTQSMFDGDSATLWHSNWLTDTHISWARVTFHAKKSIHRVEVLKRIHSSQSRYGNMCIVLFEDSSQEIETKCTTGATGTPYLTEDGKSIVFDFDNAHKVLIVEIVFTGGILSSHIGQISELFIHGTHKG